MDSRLVAADLPQGESEGYGLVQVARINDCSVSGAEDAVYSEFKNDDKTQGEEVRKGKYCKKGKGKICDDDKDYFTEDYSSCYGIKSSSSQYLIVDTFSINYNLCKIPVEIEVGGENESS